MMLILLREATAKLRRQRARRITINQLSALDDRVLRDIGIARSEIRSVVESLIRQTEPRPQQSAPVVPIAASDKAHKPTATDFEPKAAA